MLVHLKTNRIFSLSPTGARFWELLSDGRTRAETEAALAEEYDVRGKRCRAEIDSLVTTDERSRSWRRPTVASSSAVRPGGPRANLS